MKKMILIMILCLFSFNYLFGAKPVYIKGGTLYLNSDIIKNTTQRVNFTITGIELNIPGEGKKEAGYFTFGDSIKSLNGFIEVVDVRVNSSTNSVTNEKEVWFKDKNGNTTPNIQMDISGTFIFHWENYKKNDVGNSIISFGNIKFVGASSEGTRGVELDLKQDIATAMISKIKIQVTRDLHLGWGIAKEEFDSEPGKGQSVGGHSAEIILKCDKDTRYKEIELTMPSKVIIRNSNGKEKEVALRFESNISGAEIDNEDDGEKEIEVPFKEDIIIEINGNMQTTKNDEKGVYTGSFIVRAEYDED